MYKKINKEFKYAFKVDQKGVDTREGKNIRLWSFALFAILFALLSHYNLSNPRDIERASSVAGDIVTRVEINEYKEVDRLVTEALAEYQSEPENYEKSFLPLRTLCEDGGCERMLATNYVLEQYLDDLAIITASPLKLLEILNAMDVLEPHTWEYQDIDSDGAKELVLVNLDMLNHNFLDVAVADSVDGRMTSFGKRFDDYHYFSSPDSKLEPLRPLQLLDVTGDAVPEILVFGSWGRMGARLRILQYADSEIKDREFIDDFTYPVYTFYDIDKDGVLEISVSGDDPCSFGVFRYSCDRMYKDAVIKYNRSTNTFVYSSIKKGIQNLN